MLGISSIRAQANLYGLSLPQGSKGAGSIGSLKFIPDKSKEVFSNVRSKNIPRLRVSTRRLDFPGECLPVRDNLRRIFSWLQGRQRCFQTFVQFDVGLHTT